ncbi:MAG: type I-F CRISPR-associated protein Csy2 [Gallionella sp.]|nr:type I-F CRISPR-associated protein Csy2 [Gallionella sp.]
MYFLIKNMDIRGANALSAYPVASGVSPLAIAGFVRNLAMGLGLEEAENLPFAIVHHSTQIKAEQTSSGAIPHQRIGALLTCSSANKSGSTDYAKESMSLGLQPVIECNTQLSVIIDFGDTQLNEQAVFDAVGVMRIAGGQVQSCDGVYAFDTAGDAARRAGAGHVYVDRSQDLLSVSPEARTQVFVENLYPAYLPAEHDFKKQLREQEVKPAWLVPFNLGWLPLTEFSQKEGGRNGLEHAYAEPLVGLVEMVSARKAVFEKQPFIWKMKKMDGAYVVTTNI